MNTENKGAKNKNRRIWGWIMAILGGVFSVVSIFFSLQPYHEVFEQGHDMLYLLPCYCTIPGLILGILLLVFGIRRIIRTGK
jgi:TRAP-type C4-dicarboxylate transport system permease small subunit